MVYPSTLRREESEIVGYVFLYIYILWIKANNTYIMRSKHNSNYYKSPTTSGVQ